MIRHQHPDCLCDICTRGATSNRHDILPESHCRCIPCCWQRWADAWDDLDHAPHGRDTTRGYSNLLRTKHARETEYHEAVRRAQEHNRPDPSQLATMGPQDGHWPDHLMVA